MFYGLLYKRSDNPEFALLNDNHKTICKIMNDMNTNKKEYLKDDLVRSLVINMDDLTNKILNVDIDENLINELLSSGPKKVALFLGKNKKKVRLQTKIKSAINKLGNFGSDLSSDIRKQIKGLSKLEQEYRDNQELRYKKQIINENILDIFNLDVKELKPGIKRFYLII